MPLSFSSQEDSWFWALERSSCYSVKSGYRLIMRDFVAALPHQDYAHWSHVWNLSVPPKVKNFLSRTISHCLPTRFNLKNRHLPLSELCPLCNRDVEDSFHALCTCDAAKAVWRSSPIGDLSASFTNFSDFWSSLVNGAKDLLELAAVISWLIWCHRNEVLWQGKISMAGVIFQRAVSALIAWRQAQVAPSSSSDSVRLLHVWTAPPVGFMKLNVDAVVFGASATASFGCVLRDAVGGFVAACCGAVAFQSDPTMVEVLSIREALSWIKDRGWSNVQIETNSMVVVQSMAYPLAASSPFNAIVKDCLSIMNELSKCSIAFVRRSTNHIAHVLARNAYNFFPRKVWFTSPPDFLVIR
ncbi:hypothetical protein OROHE_013884 [Orobanche hederae]